MMKVQFAAAIFAIALAGEALPESDNTRASIISHLAARLMTQDQSDVSRITPQMASAISANCHHGISPSPSPSPDAQLDS